MWRARIGVREGVSVVYKETLTKSISCGRVGAPGDIAQAAFFLCSEEAEFLTGAVIPVDGGSSAGRYFLPLSS